MIAENLRQLFLLALISLNFRSPLGQNLAPRIGGGYQPSNINNLGKYLVSLRNRVELFYGHGHFCGGALISRNQVLTAAHCLIDSEMDEIDPYDIKVVTGSFERLVPTIYSMVYHVDEVYPHEAFNEDFENDIAIIRLTEPVQLYPDVTEVARMSFDEIPGDSHVTVLGWGKMWENGPTPNELLFAELSVFDRERCEELVADFDAESMICAGEGQWGPMDACQGDSGGPLFLDNRIIGIVSFGSGCNEIGSAGVYTKVKKYQYWTIVTETYAMGAAPKLLPNSFLPLIFLISFYLL